MLEELARAKGQREKEDDLAACFPALPFPSLPMDNEAMPRGVKREQEETGTAAATTAGTTTTTTTSTGDGMWRRMGRERRCVLTAVLFVSGTRRIKIKRESDGTVVGELKTEKEEGLEEGEALWVKGDGSGVVCVGVRCVGGG